MSGFKYDKVKCRTRDLTLIIMHGTNNQRYLFFIIWMVKLFINEIIKVKLTFSF